MKIAIVGGQSRADFLIGLLLKKANKLLVINNEKHYCEYLAATHHIPVHFGDGSKMFVLDEAGVYGYDILIALTDNDADNLNICQLATRIFGIKRSVCTVSNPKNVELFKKLGVHTVISATYMLAQFIEQVSTVESLTSSLRLADNRVILSEIAVEATHPIVNKKIADIGFPKGVIISCLVRGIDIMVPNGQTVIMINDKLLIISSPQNQQAAITSVTGVNLK